VAVSASNTFILPTHQVNALIMRPGGYRTKDYMRAGTWYDSPVYWCFNGVRKISFYHLVPYS